MTRWPSSRVRGMGSPAAGREQLPLKPQHQLGQPRLQAGGASRAERDDCLVDVAIHVDQIVAKDTLPRRSRPLVPSSPVLV